MTSRGQRPLTRFSRSAPPASFSSLVRPSHAPAMALRVCDTPVEGGLGQQGHAGDAGARAVPAHCEQGMYRNPVVRQARHARTDVCHLPIFRRSVAQCDREDVKIDKERLDGFCKEHNFIGWSVPVVPAHTSPSAPALPTRPTQPALLTRHTHPP